MIVGGAGYIGSHVNKFLNENQYNTLVYDNLICGYEQSVKWGEFIFGDLSDIDRLKSVFKNNDIKVVMHFAAFSYVEESVSNPQKYYKNNVSNILNLLEVMREFSCNNFIFSSTSATYGNPKYLPIDENHFQNPINPYGQSKLMVEKILQDYSNAYDLKFVSLRYFNAAGADVELQIGENHNPETHLIPLVLDVALGKRKDIKVFGTDYDTKDGSAVRDYIHVMDIAEAHALAYEYLIKGGQSNVFNLGNGDGYSVLEVIGIAEKITQMKIKRTLLGRRKGDPDVLIGDSSKAKRILGWKPKYPGLDFIIKTAWGWHVKKNIKIKKYKKI